MADQFVPTSAPLSEEPSMIVNSIQIVENVENQILDPDEDIEEKIYTRNDVLLSLDMLKSFAAQRFDANYTQMCIRLINNLENALIKNAPVKTILKKLVF